VEVGYARVSTAERDLQRQIEALTAAGVGHARAVAGRLGRQVGRPSLLDPAALAVQLRDRGHTMAQIVATTGMTRSSLYRYLPPRPPAPLTATEQAEQAVHTGTAAVATAAGAAGGVVVAVA